MSPPPNAQLLEEITRANVWFHARRVRPIWVKEIEKDQTIDTIEGPTRARAGDCLCRGEAGEVWPQSARRLEEKYRKTDEVDADGWRKYAPRPDDQGVMAAQVDHPFSVQAKWGVLAGKAGDFVLKNYADRDVPTPEDVWLVDQKLFRATYQAVDPKP